MKARLLYFFNELQRRRVTGTALTYLVAGWLVIESSAYIMPQLGMPESAPRITMFIVFAGFPVVIVLSWFFNITADKPTTNRSTQVDLDGAVANLVVVPFETSSDSTDAAALAAALPMDISTKLSRYPRLKVAPYRSSHTRSADASLEELTARLGVRFVVSGSVLATRQTLSVHIVIDDALTKAQIWSRRFDSAQDDLVETIEQISDAVALAFGTARLATELKDTAPTSLWSQLQRARGLLLDGRVSEAESAVSQVLKQDSTYADALAVGALVQAEQILRSADAEGIASAADEARRYAETAARNAPNDPHVLKLAGVAFAISGNPDRGLELLDRSLDLAPLDTGARGYLGWPLTSRGRDGDLDRLLAMLDALTDEASDHPGYALWCFHKSVALTCQADSQSALAFAETAASQLPNHALIRLNFANLLGLHEPANARAQLERAAAGEWTMPPEQYQRLLQFVVQHPAWIDRRTAGLRGIGAL